VLLIACGAAVAMLGPREGQTPPEVLKIPELPALPIAGGPPVIAIRPVDGSIVSGRFGAIGNAPKVPEPPPVVVTDAGTSTPEPTSPETVEILYLGPAALGGTRFGLVAEGGLQRIVAIRDVLGDGRVTDITVDQLTLDVDGTEKVIPRSPKGSDVVTRANGAGAVAANKASSIRRNTASAQLANAAMQANRSRFQPAIPPGASAPNKVDPAAAAAARYQQVVEKIRASGQFGTDQATIEKAALQLMNAEGDKSLLEKDPS